MWEHILIVVIVIIAALYVVRGLRRTASGNSACRDDHCAECPYGGGCGHGLDETCPTDHHPDETEQRQP